MILNASLDMEKLLSPVLMGLWLLTLLLGGIILRKTGRMISLRETSIG